jgi:RpiB/LacA/LacB family sugar-phosphate isomerase
LEWEIHQSPCATRAIHLKSKKLECGGKTTVRIAIASDEVGNELKEQVAAMLATDGHEIVDPSPSVDQHSRSDYAEQVALAVLRRDADRGVILTSRGVGASVAANRVPGIRAALCNDSFSAYSGAKSEGMNVLILSVHSLDLPNAKQIIDAYAGAALAPIEVVGGLPPRRLQRVLEYVKENIEKDLSVAEMAQVVGMSQYYFSKLFKMSTGTTPHQYVMRQRVERAQELLREGNTALVEIATHVGFETQSHFTSVFRRLVGITPKKFREMRTDGLHLTTPTGKAEEKSNATAA